MARSVGLTHIIRHDDGVSTGVWGLHTLKSAFQPIFAFADGRLVMRAFEGLIRPFRDDEAWSPAAFFESVSVADRMHVETLTRTLHLLNAATCLPDQAMVFVNFDPSVFTDRAVSDAALRDMRLTLHEADIDPHRVVCELTEQRSGSQEALLAFVSALKDHGFRIAVDDYGAADSDMSRIRELHPDIVKFDAKWIARLMESGPGLALLSTMVRTFTDQGIETVFEGIEERWQLEFAEQAGATMAQGFVLARPELASTSFKTLAAQAEIQATAVVEALTDEVRAAPQRHGRIFGRRAAS